MAITSEQVRLDWVGMGEVKSGWVRNEHAQRIMRKCLIITPPHSYVKALQCVIHLGHQSYSFLKINSIRVQIKF
jgi:hypothetical protein